MVIYSWIYSAPTFRYYFSQIVTLSTIYYNAKPGNTFTV